MKIAATLHVGTPLIIVCNLGRVWTHEFMKESAKALCGITIKSFAYFIFICQLCATYPSNQ